VKQSVAEALAAGGSGVTHGTSAATDFQWMTCTCNKHWRYITVKGAQQSSTALRCKICDRPPSLSQPALDATLELNKMPHRYAYECRALRGKFGPFDFWFPDIQLAVEVDGEQHFAGGMFNDASDVVRCRDYSKMRACWEMGWGMLRVHHFDARDFYTLLRRAELERLQNPCHAFVIFSAAWPSAGDLLQRNGAALPEVQGSAAAGGEEA
jgi:hypothetical protein